METKNLTNIMGLVVIVVLLGAFAAPAVMDAAERTETHDNESPDWVRLSLTELASTTTYGFTVTLADGNATIGTLSGAADDMILYADTLGTIAILDGSIVYLYDDNGTAKMETLGNNVTVNNQNGQLTVTDGVDTYTRSSATWAYYPSANGTYSSYGAGNVYVNTSNTHIAAAGSFAGVSAYNDLLVPELDGVTMNVDGSDAYIESITWGLDE